MQCAFITNTSLVTKMNRKLLRFHIKFVQTDNGETTCPDLSIWGQKKITYLVPIFVSKMEIRAELTLPRMVVSGSGLIIPSSDTLHCLIV